MISFVCTVIVLLGFCSSVLGKCHLGHGLGEEYAISGVFHIDDPLKFVFDCQSKKKTEDGKPFFYYNLQACLFKNVTYKPGETWRQDNFKFQCYFKFGKDGSLSEIRHVGCYVKSEYIEKGQQALIGNFRYTCAELGNPTTSVRFHFAKKHGLHPISCISSKEAVEIPAGETLNYGLDSYICKETNEGLSLKEETRFEPCKLPADIAVAYLIDTSESIRESKFDDIVKPVLADELDNYPEKAQVRLLSYSTNWRSHSDWISMTAQSRPLLRQKALTLPYLGEGTKTASALRNTSRLFEGVQATAKFIILVTDGEARDKDQIPAAVQELAEKSIKVVSVGVGDGVNKKELAEYGFVVLQFKNFLEWKKAMQNGKVRCKLFESVRKTFDAKKFCDEWANKDSPVETKFLPTCPTTRTLVEAASDLLPDPTCADSIYVRRRNSRTPGWKNCKYNPGARVCYLTKPVDIFQNGLEFKSRNQCCYDSSGILIRNAYQGAGTADKANDLNNHIVEDLQPAEFCAESGMIDIYYLHRPSP